MTLKELKTEAVEKINCLVKTAEIKTAKNGSQYFSFTLTDGDSEITANMWDSNPELQGNVGLVCVCEIKKQMYKDKESYLVQSMNVADENPDDYVRAIPDTEKMYKEMVEVIKGFKNPILQRVTGCLIQSVRKEFVVWGGAKKIHHALKGGLIYHEYRMMKQALAMAEIYPSVDKDLLLAGVLCHDLGKLKELDTDQYGTSENTTSGLLLGHVFLGMQMVLDLCKEKEIDTNDESVKMLLHLIASHHGKLEWGALAVPQTIEAMILHEIDMIDSRAYMFEENLPTEEGTFSEKVFGLDGRVYRKVENNGDDK